MNNLWIFGASMSQPFVPAYDNVVEHTLDDSEGWPGMLADKMGVKLINLAGAGNSNFEMLYKFFTHFQFMKKRDTAIFQFVGWDLVKIFPFPFPMHKLDFETIEKLGGWDKVVETHALNIIRDGFIKNVIPLLKEKKIKYKFWFTNEDDRNQNIIKDNWPNCLPIPTDKEKYGIFESWQALIEEQWQILPNGAVDKHFNKKTHKLFSDYIFNNLKQRKRDKLKLMHDKTFDGWWKFSEKNKEIYNNGNVGVLLYDFETGEFTPITISPEDFLSKYKTLQEGEYDMDKKHILQTEHPGWPGVKKLYD